MLRWLKSLLCPPMPEEECECHGQRLRPPVCRIAIPPCPGLSEEGRRRERERYDHWRARCVRYARGERWMGGACSPEEDKP